MIHSLWSQLTYRSKWIFGICIASFIALLALDIADSDKVAGLEGWGYLALATAVLGIVVPGIYRLGRVENPNLTEVCMLSGFVILFINPAIKYTCYDSA